jgi:hypothetical protein
MATAAYTQTIDTTGTWIYEQQDAGCTAFVVKNQAASENPVLVHVEGLHDPGDYYQLAAGEAEIFRVKDGELRRIHVKGNGGEAIIDFAIVART